MPVFLTYFQTVFRFLRDPKQFLLSNIGVKQTVAKNVFWQSASEIVVRILKLVLFFYIGRTLGVTEYGRFSYALGFVALFSIISDLGIAKLIFREFSKYPEKEKDFPAILSLEIILSLVAFLAMSIGILLITKDYGLRLVMAVIGIYYLINIFPAIFSSVFKARQKMEYQAWLDIVSTAVTVSCAVAVLKLWPSVINLGFSYLVTAIFSLAVAALIFHWKIFSFKLFFDPLTWKIYIKSAWPFALNAAISTVIVSFDSVLMGYYKMFDSVGFYSAAQKIIGIGIIPASFISVSLFPILSRLWAEDKGGIQKIWGYYMSSLFFLGVPFCFGAWMLGVPVASYVYGSDFVIAGRILQILVFSNVISVCAVPFSHILVVADKVKSIVKISVLALLLNIILNLILIPRFLYNGAVFANVVTNLLILTSQIFLAKKYSGISLWDWSVFRNFIVIVISSVIMSVFITLLSSWNLIAVVVLAILAYVSSFLIGKYFEFKLSF